VNNIKFKEIVFKLIESTISDPNLFKVLKVVKEFLNENSTEEKIEFNTTANQ
jgi:hypothetical protein